MKKILLTATVQSHIAQFHKPLINLLKKNNIEVHVAARNNLSEKNGLQLNEPDKIFDIPFERSPLNPSNLTAYKLLKSIISENEYDIVHCNTPMGGIITRLAAKKARDKGLNVFYTAHGFHFYKNAPLKNWVMYYPIEKLFANYTDKLITITKEDYNLAIKKFNTEVNHMHGVGANSLKYYPYSKEKIIFLKKESGYQEKDFLLLCIGELNSNKNQETVIRAIGKIAIKNPEIKLLIAGNGPKEKTLRDLCKKLGIQNKVIFLGYRTDLDKFINISDITISVSHREGLPLNVIEAMLCSKPVIVSHNRGHSELVEDGKNGYLIKANDVDKLSKYIVELRNDTEKRYQFGKKGFEYAQKYTSKGIVNELTNIYKIL